MPSPFFVCSFVGSVLDLLLWFISKAHCKRAPSLQNSGRTRRARSREQLLPSRSLSEAPFEKKKNAGAGGQAGGWGASAAAGPGPRLLRRQQRAGEPLQSTAREGRGPGDDVTSAAALCPADAPCEAPSALYLRRPISWPRTRRRPSSQIFLYHLSIVVARGMRWRRCCAAAEGRPVRCSPRCGQSLCYVWCRVFFVLARPPKIYFTARTEPRLLLFSFQRDSGIDSSSAAAERTAEADRRTLSAFFQARPAVAPARAARLRSAVAVRAMAAVPPKKILLCAHLPPACSGLFVPAVLGDRCRRLALLRPREADCRSFVAPNAVFLSVCPTPANTCLPRSQHGGHAIHRPIPGAAAGGSRPRGERLGAVGDRKLKMVGRRQPDDSAPPSPSL